MSNEEVLTRKDMKAPDKFQSVASRAVDWIAGHKKHARLASAVVAALVVVVIVAAMAGSSREQKSGALAFELLRTVGGEIAAVPLPGQTGPIFASDADRQRAIIVEAGRVIAEYPTTASGRLALLMKGDAQLKLGEADAAIASYQKYLAETSSEQTLRFGALEGLALAHEAKGKPDEAAAAWARAAREAARFSDHADLQQARVLAGAGKVDEARKLLDGFATRHKDSTFVAEAAQRLARLGAK